MKQSIIDSISLLDEAHFLHSFGFNILPVIGKKPTLVNWKELQTRQQTRSEFEGYNWSVASGLAIVCGVSGFHAIDLDQVIEESVLYEWLDRLELPQKYTWVERTGSGVGYQIIFKSQGDLSLTVRKADLADGRYKRAELRCSGCYSVVPPSKHPDTDMEYIWLNGKPLGEPSILNAQKVKDVFENMTGQLCSGSLATPEGQLITKQANDYLKYIGEIPEGQRDEALFKLACHWRDVRLPMKEALLLALVLNRHYKPPLEDNIVKQKVQSAYKYRGNTDKQVLAYRDAASVMSIKLPPPRNLVEGLIKETSLNILAGDSGTGKSMIAMNLSISIASGKKFLAWEVKEKRKVLFLDNEVGQYEYVRRLQTMRNESELGMFEFLNEAPEIENYHELDEKCAHFRPALLVFDSLYLAHFQKENDASGMKEVLKKFKNLAQTYHMAVLLVHHFRKGVKYDKLSMEMVSGTGAFGRITDTGILIRRSDKDETKRIFKPDKLRGFSDENRQVHLLEFNPNSFWFSDLGIVDERDHTARLGDLKISKRNLIDILNGKEGGMTRKEIQAKYDEFGLSAATMDRDITQGLEGGTIYKLSYGKYGLTPPLESPPVEQTKVEDAIISGFSDPPVE